MKIEFEIIEKNQILDSHRDTVAALLEEQGKVKGDLKTKADRCKLICIALYNGSAVAIGAIKQKTGSDFKSHKADVPALASDFDWELGYFFTSPKFQGKGIARSITAYLLEVYGKENLMASTEVSANPIMVKILESNDFKLYGKPWKSAMHDNYLGLYLRFK